MAKKELVSDDGQRARGMVKKALLHPTHPTRAKTRALPWRGRASKQARAYRGPVALLVATGERYVEPLSAVRTKLAAFFNILLERGGSDLDYNRRTVSGRKS